MRLAHRRRFSQTLRTLAGFLATCALTLRPGAAAAELTDAEWTSAHFYAKLKHVLGGGSAAVFPRLADWKRTVPSSDESKMLGYAAKAEVLSRVERLSRMENLPTRLAALRSLSGIPIQLGPAAYNPGIDAKFTQLAMSHPQQYKLVEQRFGKRVDVTVTRDEDFNYGSSDAEFALYYAFGRLIVEQGWAAPYKVDAAAWPGLPATLASQVPALVACVLMQDATNPDTGDKYTTAEIWDAALPVFSLASDDGIEVIAQVTSYLGMADPPLD